MCLVCIQWICGCISSLAKRLHNSHKLTTVFARFNCCYQLYCILFEVIKIHIFIDKRICHGYFIPLVFPNSTPCPLTHMLVMSPSVVPLDSSCSSNCSFYSQEPRCHSPLQQKHLLKRACSLIQNILSESKSDVRASRSEEKNSKMRTWGGGEKWAAFFSE